ncbi:MAG TPA: hypothetical protein VHK91_16515 [Flavisolibacter sp.]|jgi:hypothetical protein|nr:hypothetical protein [Flavisolibacter sp.]
MKTLMLLSGICLCGCFTKPCVETNYYFKVQAKILPENESINIGDTLYIVSNFSSSLLDQRSGKVIEYSDAVDLNSTIGIGRIDPTDSIPKEAVNDFKYLSEVGNIYNDPTIPKSNGVQQLSFNYSNDSYQLKVGMVPIKKGLYVIGLANGLSIGRKGSKACEKAAFEFSVSNLDQHFNSYTTLFQDHTITEYEKKHAYYFQVQ